MPKISQFPAGGAAQNTDLIPIVRNGGDYTVTGYNLASLASYGQAYVGTFTATAGQTVFTLPASPGSLANLFISVDGAVMVPGSDYTWTTPTTLTFLVGLKVGQVVLYNYTTSVPIGTSLAGGVSGQVQYNNSGVLNGTTIGGDATLVATTGALTVTKTAGVAFAASATTDTTNAANIASGILPVARQSYTQGATGSTARTVTNKLQESVSVLDFGADPTGVADSTTAIQNAIAALGATGGVVNFPPGNYKVASTINAAANVCLRGPRLFETGAATLTSTHDNNIILVGSSATQFVIDGLAFVGRVTEASLVQVNANNFSARHCSFNFSAVSGIQFGTVVACCVDHCFGQNLVYSRASLVAPTGGLHILGTDHYIANNEFNCQSGQTGVVSSGGYACSIYVGGSNNFVSDNIGEFGETGIYVDASKSRFTGNRADRCMGYGWVVAGNSNMFAANQAIQCGTATTNTYDGWKVSGNLNRFAACGVPYLGVSTLRYGWNDTTASATQKNEYVGCSCEENVGTAKFFNNYNGGGFLFGTGWYQYNSGTSLDVSGMNKLYLAHSTTTTVTAFTGGVSGQTLTLLSNTGNVTIATNATIKTVAGSNLVMAANTIYEFTYWNTVWYQHF